MKKHNRIFKTTTEFETFKASSEFILPNVSYIEESNSMSYSPYIKPEPPAFEMVDLGLSVKWAKCNIGAENPEEDGLYFAWGEIQGYTGITSDKKFKWSDYKYCAGSSKTLTKYCNNSTYGNNGFTDNLLTLEEIDDAAHKLISGSWRMPTKAEFEELISGTTQTVDTINGVKGMRFTSTNGNSIFVPFAGSCGNGNLSGHGSNCFLWSSIVSEVYSSSAWYLNCDSYAYAGMRDNSRYYGFSVRGVCE